eukprot:779867-Rhodomonas_salina.1
MVGCLWSLCLQSPKESMNFLQVTVWVLRSQDDGVQWTKDMDYQLSLFVRKYAFDFPKAAKAMRAFVEHV